MDEVFVRLKDMPFGMQGVTVLDADGDYNVYINARLSYEDQQEVYRHEITHIMRQDFYTDIPIQEAEKI